jgi:hypothetical protein
VERIDPARVKFKPLSLLRQDAKRVLEQYLDAENPQWPKADRDRLVEDVIGEAPGTGVLEELFRDESVKEILILEPRKIIVRKDESWLPVSVFFRDETQLRSFLARATETGENLSLGPPSTCATDVRISNGFRVLAILPPVVMETAPVVVLQRGMPVATPAPLPAEGPRSGIIRRETPPVTISSTMTPPKSNPPVDRISTGDTTFLMPPPPPPAATASPSPTDVLTTPAPLDPLSRYRQKATNLMVSKLAAAGVYDLTALPTLEMNRLVAAVVDDMNLDGRLDLSEAEKDRLTLEILAGMNR